MLVSHSLARFAAQLSIEALVLLSGCLRASESPLRKRVILLDFAKILKSSCSLSYQVSGARTAAKKPIEANRANEGSESPRLGKEREILGKSDFCQKPQSRNLAAPF